MHRFSASKTLGISIDRVWPLLDNFADTWVYHPIVEDSGSLNGTTRGLGAERYCTMYGGEQVQERITEYDAENHRYKVEITDHGPFPLTHMEVWVKVDAEGQNRTTVTFEGGFVPKFGPMGWVMGKLMMKRQFEAMMGQVIDGLESHLKTGLVVGKGGELEDAPAMAA